LRNAIGTQRGRACGERFGDRRLVHAM
jgi:hypothetical protein